MLREDFGSVHLNQLAENLGIEMTTAIGHLELLWNYTADMAPAGNVGIQPNMAIARYCEWQGDPDVFIAELVANNWLAEHPTARLVVVRWKQIARPWIKAKLKRMGLEFVLPPGEEPDPPKGGPADITAIETVMTFPTVASNSDWPLSKEKLEEWAQAFPGVDVLQECTKALQWCRDNPSKRKTFGGMTRFLNQWLSRQQDDATKPGRASRMQQTDDALSQIFGRIP